MRAPLFIAAVLFSLGLFAQWFIGLPPLFLWSSVLVAAVVVLCFRRSERILWIGLLAGLVLLGMLRAQADSQSTAALSARVFHQPGWMELRGQLENPPTLSRDHRSASGWIAVQSVRSDAKWEPVLGRLLVRLPVQALYWESGLRLELRGMVRAGKEPEPDGKNHRSHFNERQWLWLKGACGVITVSEIENVAVIGIDRAFPARFCRGVDRFKQKLQSVGREQLDGTSSGLLEGLLLGESSGILPQTWEAFRATGTIHLLVVSGLQVGLVGLWIRLLLGWCGLSGAAMNAATALSLVAYAVMAGLNPPIVRATVIGILLCGASWRGVGVSIWNLLGASALFILWSHPRSLADPGFQLSFASVMAIVAVGQWQTNRPKIEPDIVSPISRLIRAARHALEISTAAWIATAPILWIHFRSFSWIAPVINLAAVPWASGLTALGFLVYAMGLIHWPAAGLFAAAFEWGGEWFIKIVDKISSIC